jgi:hypothetical protein
MSPSRRVAKPYNPKKIDYSDGVMVIDGKAVPLEPKELSINTRLNMIMAMGETGHSKVAMKQNEAKKLQDMLFSEGSFELDDW